MNFVEMIRKRNELLQAKFAIACELRDLENKVKEELIKEGAVHYLSVNWESSRHIR